jgi:hypothetical protein
LFYLRYLNIITCSVDSSLSIILALIYDLLWTARTLFYAVDISMFVLNAILTVQMCIIERGVVSRFFGQTCSNFLCMGLAWEWDGHLLWCWVNVDWLVVWTALLRLVLMREQREYVHASWKMIHEASPNLWPVCTKLRGVTFQQTVIIVCFGIFISKILCQGFKNLYPLHIQS